MQNGLASPPSSLNVTRPDRAFPVCVANNHRHTGQKALVLAHWRGSPEIFWTKGARENEVGRNRLYERPVRTSELRASCGEAITPIMPNHRVERMPTAEEIRDQLCLLGAEIFYFWILRVFRREIITFGDKEFANFFRDRCRDPLQTNFAFWVPG